MGCLLGQVAGRKGKDDLLTILASGFDITIADKKDTEDDVITFGADRPDTRANTAHTVADKKENEDIKSLIASEYGEDKMTSHSQEMARKKYVVLKPSQFDNDEAIAMFAKIRPTTAMPPLPRPYAT